MHDLEHAVSQDRRVVGGLEERPGECGLFEDLGQIGFHPAVARRLGRVRVLEAQATGKGIGKVLINDCPGVVGDEVRSPPPRRREVDSRVKVAKFLIMRQPTSMLAAEPLGRARTLQDSRGLEGKYHHEICAPTNAYDQVVSLNTSIFMFDEEQAEHRAPSTAWLGGKIGLEHAARGGYNRMSPAVQLQDELAVFEQRKPELLTKFEGFFFLVKGNQIDGPFSTPSEAYDEGLRKYGLQPFLVRQVVRQDPVGFAPAFYSAQPSSAGL